jgi:hypothetical protein
MTRAFDKPGHFSAIIQNLLIIFLRQDRLDEEIIAGQGGEGIFLLLERRRKRRSERALDLDATLRSCDPSSAGVHPRNSLLLELLRLEASIS